MINVQTLKEIITSNEEFILRNIKRPVKRNGYILPESSKKVVVFHGVRRSGKTFILYDLFKLNKGHALYVDFEDERLTGFESGDFERLKRAFLEIRPGIAVKEPVLLLDEVQNVNGWEKFCRRAVEREGFKVFVSGSSSKVMPAEIQTELRGRSWSIEILPFSFKEYLGLSGIHTIGEKHLYGREGVRVKQHFNDFLKWGGFPEVALSPSEFEKKKLLKEYFEAMFFRDIVERFQITNIPLLDALLDKVFSSFSTKFSLTAFYRQYRDKMPFSKDFLFRYYRHLLQSMLIFEVRMYAESSYRRMRNPAKIYPVDTGLCKRVTSADSGRLLENVVFLEMRRRGYETFYFSEAKECDFVVKTGQNVMSAYQVCYILNDNSRAREIEGLTLACKHLGIKDGILLTDDEEDEVTAEGISIMIMPVWKWLLRH